ncbi:MAG TPA: hypothetical protein VHZ73_01105, partial [Vicinamibacterales bacterium]|nr:hypothetical protein [Vicinamibacterales bacterium]
MRRLYFKIFLWFWLGIVVVSLTLASVATLTYSREDDDRVWQEKYGPRVDLWSRQEIDILDQQGLQQLSRYLGSFEYDPGVTNYIFDANGHELLNREPSPAVRHVLAAAGQKAGQNIDAKERIIADTLKDEHGHLYTVVVDQPAPTILNRSVFEFLF